MNQISEILQNARTIAVVGLSGKRFRPSYGVAEYMQRAGYRIIPVNPREKAVLGRPSYPSLAIISSSHSRENMSYASGTFGSAYRPGGVKYCRA